MKFKVGDRVRVIDEFAGVNLKGKVGTVVKVFPDGYMYEIGVEFDEPLYGWYGHDCGNKAKDSHGRWVYASELELVTESKKIVITTDGLKTIARLYEDDKVVKSATAKCSPIDTFSFEVGAKLAFERLFPGETKIEARNIKFNDGDYARITANEYGHNFPIGTIVKLEKGSNSYKAFANGESWWVADSELTLVEHLLVGKEFYGVIGEKTNYKDAVGRPLCVGDVVEVFDNEGWSHSEHTIVKCKLLYRNNQEKVFVQGIESNCDAEKGTTGRWKIIKTRSFEEVANGEEICHAKYIKNV